MICSPEDVDNFNIVTWVLQGYIFAPNVCMLHQENAVGISKLATIVEGDPKAPFSIAYYTKV